MKKYWTVFKISWSREITYRFNFVISRIQNLTILVVLYFMWNALSIDAGVVAGFSRNELLTYALVLNVFRSLIMSSQSRLMSLEINDGTFSMYLVKPLSHFWFVFSRELAQRAIQTIASIAETMILVKILNVELSLPRSMSSWFLSGGSLILAIFLYFTLSYFVSLLAFWSRENMGPRFLFEWILEMTSGGYYPISIFFQGLFIFLSFLPFAYLFFYPLFILLGKTGIIGITRVLAIQSAWIAVFGVATFFVWRKGLRRFNGEGI